MINKTLLLCIFCIFFYLFDFNFCQINLININEGKYPQVKLLSSGNYFVVLDNGVYIYNPDLTIKYRIYSFSVDEIINDKDYQKTVISEFNNDVNIFISCLTKGKFLYVFDVKTNNLAYKIDLESRLDNIQNYNLITYKYQNNILEFIIYFIYQKEINFLDYKIDLLNNNIKNNSSVYKDNDLANDFVSCENIALENQNNKNYLICFSTKNKYIKVNFYDIENNFLNMNPGNITTNDKFYGFQSIKSFNRNIFFLCYLNAKYYCYCYLYDKENTKFLDDKKYISVCQSFDLYYFNNENILFCYYMISFSYKSYNGKFSEEYKYIFQIFDLTDNFFHISNYISDEITFNKGCDHFSLAYSKSTHSYSIINSCDSEEKVISGTIPEYTKILPPSEIILSSEKASQTSSFPSDILPSLTIISHNLPSNILLNSDYSSKDATDFDISAYIEKIISETKRDELMETIPEIIKLIKIGESYESKSKRDNFTLSIKPLNASYQQNSTHINFKQCENILRDIYKIGPERIITFLQLEMVDNKEKSIVNQVEYQVYDDNKTKLDLSICNDSNIQIFFALKENSLDIDIISFFKNKGIDIFNIKDSFFTDICQSFSDPKKQNDIVLEDRIKEIFQNFSVCNEGCKYSKIDLETKTMQCDCQVKYNLSTNESLLNLEKFDDIDIDSNFGLIKCYKLVFSFKGKKGNIGFWIFAFLVGLHIPLLINICYKGFKPIKEFILNEMEKHGYIKGMKNANDGKKKSINKKHSMKKNLEPPKKKKSKKRIKKNKKSKIIIDNSSLNHIKLSDKEIINDINSDLINSNCEEINKENNKSSVLKNKKREIKKKKDNKKILINNVFLLKGSKRKKKQKKINVLTTQISKNMDVPKTKDEKKIYNFNLININLNNIKINNKNYTPPNSYIILNNYTYKEAIEYDMRSICAIFYIFLLSKQAAFHAFLYRSPLESFPIRVCLLIFIISSDLALNAVFYLDDKISKKYKYAKNLFLFTFNNNLTIILISTLIGFVIMTLFTNLSNSTNNIRNIFLAEEVKLKQDKKYKVSEKRKKEILEEIEKILNRHKIKVIVLMTIEIFLMLFFWYYVTAFCHVYSSTQLSWLLDSFLSILSRFIFELLISLGFAKLYRIAVESNVECIYKFVIFFYCFG